MGATFAAGLESMVPLVGIVTWFAIGATVGLIEARRGHWQKGRAVLSVFGPLAIFLAARARDREAEASPALNLMFGSRASRIGRTGNVAVLLVRSQGDGSGSTPGD